MAKPKKKTAPRKRIAPKPQASPAQTSAPALPNLNQTAPKLNYRIAGTPILPGQKA